MFQTVDFGEKKTHFLGRNGEFVCTGLELFSSDHLQMITVFPVTSQGKTGRCMIEVPVEHIDDFIKGLKSLKQGIELKEGERGGN